MRDETSCSTRAAKAGSIAHLLSGECATPEEGECGVWPEADKARFLDAEILDDDIVCLMAAARETGRAKSDAGCSAEAAMGSGLDGLGV